MLVAIIAIARKVIVMDFEKYSGLEILGISSIILALAGGYYLIKKTGGCNFWPNEVEEKKETILEEKTFDNENPENVVERKKISNSTIVESPVIPPHLKETPHNHPIPREGNKPEEGSEE
jgi:hypothetical protein